MVFQTKNPSLKAEHFVSTVALAKYLQGAKFL